MPASEPVTAIFTIDPPEMEIRSTEDRLSALAATMPGVLEIRFRPRYDMSLDYTQLFVHCLFSSRDDFTAFEAGISDFPVVGVDMKAALSTRQISNLEAVLTDMAVACTEGETEISLAKFAQTRSAPRVRLSVKAPAGTVHPLVDSAMSALSMGERALG